MKFAKIAAAAVFALGIAAWAPAAYGQTAQFSDGALPPQSFPVNEMDFKLKAGGQIDFAAGTISLAGQSTHIGQFTYEGPFDAATWTSSGLMADANGYFANVTITLAEQASGEYTVTMSFIGIRSRSVLLGGYGSGPLHMDQDFMFTMDVEGRFQKCLLRKCLA